MKGNKSMISTAFFRSQLLEALNKTSYTVDEIVRKAGISKSTFYANIMDEQTQRTNISVAVSIADAMGLKYKRDKEKFYLIPPESDTSVAEKNREALRMLESLKPETRDIFLSMLKKLVEGESNTGK